MIQLHLPWIELSIAIPLLGALVAFQLRDRSLTRRFSIVVCGLTLVSTLCAWQDFNSLTTFEAHDRWDLFTTLFGIDLFVIDELSAPLIPLAALLYLMTTLATLRTKVRRFSFGSSLISEAILIATLSCREAWALIFLLALAGVPVMMELRSRERTARIFAIHHGLFVGMLLLGWGAESLWGGSTNHSLVAIVCLTVAVLVRSGSVPLHCWVTDMFENATFGTALLYMTPMIGAYAAMRLLVPIAPDNALRLISYVSLATAVYAAGMALVQRDARRFFAYLFLSHSALVLVGLETASPVGFTGGLSVWLSVGLALGGFGLVLRSVEARYGSLSLREYHGLSETVPILGAFFLLTGLASIGFPGTIGFIATEILVEGASEVSPLAGIVVVFAAALNGIAVIHAFLKLFTGRRRASSTSFHSQVSERIAVFALTVLILGGGFFPQAGVHSRFHAADQLLRIRAGESTSTIADGEVIDPSPELSPIQPGMKVVVDDLHP